MYKIHPLADVETLDIGDNTQIWRWAHISQGVKIGNNCMIGQGVYIGPNVIIGNNVRIQNNSYIPELVTIQNNVFIGPCAVFTNCKFPRVGLTKEYWEPTLIENDVSIGANATILCGIILGENCVIGAGSVVTKNVKKHALVYGNPAKCPK